MNKWIVILAAVFVSACATKNNDDRYEGAFSDQEKVESAGTASTKKTTVTKTTTTKKTTTGSAIVVDPKDVKDLDKMTKALEAYVLKDQEKDFLALCKDSRFDCFVDEVSYPKGRKKIPRSVPPYASGSKMGLKGEKRVQARYDFYP